MSQARADTEDGAIIIGSTGALTGPLGAIGQDMKLGVDAAIQHINSKGGIQGRPLRFDMLDDGYSAERAVENTKKLISNPKETLQNSLSCVLDVSLA
jgi:ABC-type branched-subunit amino acid transport system substrate-binding protein